MSLCDLAPGTKQSALQTFQVQVCQPSTVFLGLQNLVVFLSCQFLLIHLELDSGGTVCMWLTGAMVRGARGHMQEAVGQTGTACCRQRSPTVLQ